MNVRRGWAVFVVLLILLLGACALSLFAGPSWVPISEITESSIVRMRIARILLGIIAGAGLAVSGVIFQALLRNPLAEPYVLGVSSGAGLGAAAAIVLGLGGSGVWGVPALAFAGALCTIFLVYALARTSSGAVPVPTLLLSGVIVGAVFTVVPEGCTFCVVSGCTVPSTFGEPVPVCPTLAVFAGNAEGASVYPFTPLR